MDFASTSKNSESQNFLPGFVMMTTVSDFGLTGSYFTFWTVRFYAGFFFVFSCVILKKLLHEMKLLDDGRVVSELLPAIIILKFYFY